jgi:hypothetical protein
MRVVQAPFTACAGRLSAHSQAGSSGTAVPDKQGEGAS